MDSQYKNIRTLAEEFESCQKILIALGDENRQHLMLEMMRMEQCDDVCVGAITEKTHLSRPGSVSPSSDTQRCGDSKNAS